jgi:hypothetical protein
MGSIPDEVTMALGLTQSPISSTKSFWGGKAWLACKADNLIVSLKVKGHKEWSCDLCGNMSVKTSAISRQ